MKEFSKIGEYHVKDTQARADIELLKSKVENGGSGENVSPLPEVSVADNGKVLGVVDGKWTPTLPKETEITTEQKQEIAEYAKSILPTKTLVFTLEDDSTVTMNVVVKE